jgi:hypothetical protein
MGLSIKEGRALAEREAWRANGKRHRFFYTYGKRLIPVGAAAVVLGTLGGGAYWVWNHVRDLLAGRHVSVPSVPEHGGGVPTWTWAAMAVLAVLAPFVIRGYGDRARSLGVLALTVGGYAIAWLVLIGFMLGRIT